MNGFKYTIATLLCMALVGITYVYISPNSPTLFKYVPVEGENKNYHPGGESCKPDSLAALSSSKERVAKADACADSAEDYRLKKDDLIQQTRAAQGVEESTRYAFEANKIGFVQVILSVLAVVFTGIAALEAASAAKSAAASNEVAMKAIAFDHPPRLTITNVAVWTSGSPEKQEPNLIPGEEISGHVWLVNSGRGSARIDPADNLLMFYWGDREKLPMIRPYDRPSNSYEFFRMNVNGPADKMRTLESGQTSGWSGISTTVPDDYNSKMALYVMGYVRYKTPFGVTRMLSFCRRYKPKKLLFEAVTEYLHYELEE